MTDQTDQTPNPEDKAAAGEPEGKQAEKLAEGGKKALDAERKARREAERQAREASDRAAQLEAAELRREVAAAKGLTDAQAGFLEGSDREAMEARADELLEAFKPDESDEPPRRPRERLRSGATSAEPKDLGGVADRVMKRY